MSRQADRQTDRQTGRQTGRQAGRQAGIQQAGPAPALVLQTKHAQRDVHIQQVCQCVKDIDVLCDLSSHKQAWQRLSALHLQE